MIESIISIKIISYKYYGLSGCSLLCLWNFVEISSARVWLRVLRFILPAELSSVSDIIFISKKHKTNKSLCIHERKLFHSYLLSNNSNCSIYGMFGTSITKFGTCIQWLNLVLNVILSERPSHYEITSQSLSITITLFYCMNTKPYIIYPTY